MKMLFTRAVLLLLALPSAAMAALPKLAEYQSALRAVPDYERGAVLFVQCASCHGNQGQGLSDGSTPRIAGQNFHVIVKQLIDFRYGKRWDFRMEQRAIQHLGGFQDIADVAMYLNSQPRGSNASTANDETLAKGAVLYASNCASCHGEHAEGDEIAAVPMLAGQHPAYLLRQMYDAVDGRRPTLMQLHARRIKPLDFEQLHAVADFLSRLGSGS